MLDGSNVNSAIGSRAGEAFQKAAFTSSSSMAQPQPSPTIASLLDTAQSALMRPYGLADTVEAVGDKLIGAQPQTGNGEASGGASGSVGQLSVFLSMIHATITRLEDGASRLHSIHG